MSIAENHPLLEAICGEVSASDSRWGQYSSAHEAYAVLLEEVDELWEHVKTKQDARDLDAMRRECVQIAAVAIRFARDICCEGSGRR